MQADNRGSWEFEWAGFAASMGLAGLAVLIWINTASAAVPRMETGKSGASGYICEDRLANLYLAGSFQMPGSGEAMSLWIGRPRAVPGKNPETEVWGLLGDASGRRCEAQCKVTRFERFKKDLKPALMELDCEGSRIKTMRMPLHIQWVRDARGFETLVRMGSSIYGVEEVPLRIQVNRYEVAANRAK